MLQDASTHLIAPEPSEDLIASEPWTIETYADGLMDDLFSDIDDILDSSGNLPHPTSRTESGSRQTVTVTVPQIVLPQAVHRQQAIPPSKNQQIGTLVVKPPTVSAIQKHQQNRAAVNKLLILGAILGVAAVIVYLIQSGVLTLFTPQTLPTTQPQSQLPTKKEASAELVDYMLEALAVIDKQEINTNQISAKAGLPSSANINQTALSLPSATPIGNLPPPLTANNTQPAVNRATNVVERIYIPVYQAPSPMRYALPPIPSAARPVFKPSVMKNALSAVQQPVKRVTEKTLPDAVRTAPTTLKQPAKSLTASPVVPLRVAPPKLPTARVPTPNVEPETEPTTTQHQVFLPSAPAELEGLLELGNKSAALFKIDGVTRRVNVGENIGASGWTLVDVSNGEAIVRRNGEVRSIYAGQKF
ncbi:hypothetical protein Cylst_1280 [Cylindrospermum stagnale PCC 7417]|uniref:Type II secretion system protein GspC N-terminal domain-containing protein n=1 Tax=Cylindrospermum stagnale PCC 7417 TaxID=56107 RepID=K9WUX3_9NOST|nr:hypothetical protein [Cylindrospermum stagnale]AFZ23571.1 hypothetical protein Cylst_1280 [Cylindrospermum stagnale PCC 7417]